MTLGQEPKNGMVESNAAYYAFTHATIMASPGEVITNGTLLIKSDEIVKIGKRVLIPNDAVEIDCEGRTIIPSFVELSTSVGVPVAKSKKTGRSPQLESMKQGPYYWNEAIHPELNASELYTSNQTENKALIKSGYGFAMTHQQDGIARGKGAFVSLGRSSIHEEMTNWTSASFYSFEKGVSRQSYPSSQMGSIALLRQTFYDAIWYKDESKKEPNLSLQAINDQWEESSFFFTRSKWEILRAQKIASEFDRNFNFIGSGDEYMIIDELFEIKSTVVVPIDFPEAYDVTNPYVARQIPLSDMKHWEMAPYNPLILSENNIPFCITYAGHKTPKDFWTHLRSAVKHGLSTSDALNALTLQPAKTLGISESIGSIAIGKIASFNIYDGNPFEETCKLLQSWNLGEKTEHAPYLKEDISGKYNITIDKRQFPLTIKPAGKGKWKGTVETYSTNETLKIDTVNHITVVLLDQGDITLQVAINDTIWSGSINLQGKINTKLGIFEGSGMIPTGKWVKWYAIKSGKASRTPKKKDTPFEVDTLAVPWFPNMAYGFDSIPEELPFVIVHATAWTNEEEGIIEDATIIIEDGKITYCGTEPPTHPKDADVFDAKGMHVTSGIIDEHSHIAISRGVNESGQAITAEVSIGDVVHPDDINIYRQLSGGVTASQLLHGSANPVGGQSALIKLKWGSTPEEMLIDDAPKFIKFALGENVKQSNWGSYNNVRFPQTRMGVEQVYYDGFERARKYEDALSKFKLGEIKTKPRVDLELEVLSEILNSERFITCHSYIQSEINMLMHVADSMRFRLNTFTHILEGYKVADKMKAHGAGASTFSDWWAYKYEVNDAIPYNAKMLHDHGITVAINSDDAEMGRRLNQEAAKTVKYGGMSEIEAWKTVTLNPAKLLHLDDRMGSLKEGKDADVVIWSNNPLSVQSQVISTFVDGVLLYDAKRDMQLYTRNQQEKARLISKMLNANIGGSKRDFVKKKKGHYHCDTIGEEASLEENTH